MKIVIAAVAAATVLSALPAGAMTTEARPVAPRIPKAVVKASTATVEEGDRVTLRVKVPSSKDAKRVVLQERYTSIFDDVSWRDVTSKRAKRRLAFTQTVVAKNRADYRVAVTYRDRLKPVMSRPANLTVWRWIELRDFQPYFETTLASYGQANMNGAAYAVWGGYLGTSIRAWESRVTPGRNCTRFRAVLGLADGSDDGSSGVISFAVDEATTIYTSPTLTPGVTVPVELELARPYRFGMSAVNTSADKVKAYPMVGNGAFYCTGIDD